MNMHALWDFRGFSVRPPALSPADQALEARKKEGRRRLRRCATAIDRIEMALDTLDQREALSRAGAAASELFDLLCVLHGAAFFDPKQRDTRVSSGGASVPAGSNDARLQFAALVDQLESAANADADERTAALDNGIATARRILKDARRLFRQQREIALSTPLDRYKHQLVGAAICALAVVSASGELAWLAYRAMTTRITILEATYGENCDGRPNPAGGKFAVPRGNVTRMAASMLNGAAAGARLSVTSRYGDPAPLCGKAFRVVWSCSGESESRRGRIPAEALGKSISLRCRESPPPSSPRVRISEATYGGNCDGKPAPGGGSFSVPRGNMTDWAAAWCDLSEEKCSLTVDLLEMPDPARLCSKEFEVTWNCSDGPTRTSRIEAEALGKSVTLACQ